MAKTIDPDNLPPRILLETGVLIRAIGGFQDKHTAHCIEVADRIVQQSRTILAAAPSLAELLRVDYSRRFPKVSGLEVIAFDRAAAELVGRHYPATEIKALAAALGIRQGLVKVDAMVVACAVRHRADAIVALDDDIKKIAKKFGADCHAPIDLLPTQAKLPGTT